MSNNINQLTKKAHSLGFIDEREYKGEVIRLYILKLQFLNKNIAGNKWYYFFLYAYLKVSSECSRIETEEKYFVSALNHMKIWCLLKSYLVKNIIFE